jgi:hypothetical protein
MKGFGYRPTFNSGPHTADVSHQANQVIYTGIGRIDGHLVVHVLAINRILLGTEAAGQKY